MGVAYLYVPLGVSLKVHEEINARKWYTCSIKEPQELYRHYHIFTVKYVLFTYAIQAQVLCTYRDTISRKLYQFKICQNPYLPREIWTHITPLYHTPDFFFILSFFHLKLCWESFISSKFVKIHISLGRYGLISHPHITPQNFFFILSFFHLKLCWKTFCALNCIKHFFFSIKIYYKEIMIWQFSYHTPYQPSTSVSALDSHISPRAFGPQADIGVSG